jgi:hypothetical protein
MWLYVDGAVDAEADGPDGDVSYPDNGVPGNYCGGPCVNSDPFIVLAAEKHDAGQAYPSYRGWLDEVRISPVLRYSTSFARRSRSSPMPARPASTISTRTAAAWRSTRRARLAVRATARSDWAARPRTALVRRHTVLRHAAAHRR